jgi:Domain of unknown function (DUF4412)
LGKIKVRVVRYRRKYYATNRLSLIAPEIRQQGNKARWESHSPELEKMGGAATIYDFDAGTMTSIAPAKKMYMVMNLREMTKTAEGMSDSKKSKPDRFPKMTKTGKKETIAGYPCEHWLIGDEQAMDMCLVKGLGFWGMGGRAAAADCARPSTPWIVPSWRFRWRRIPK